LPGHTEFGPCHALARVYNLAVTWLTSNWGNLASVLGLALSTLVLIVSSGAKRAAEQARAAIELRTLSQELRACGDEVTLVGLHVQHSSWDLADNISARTLRALSYLASRWATLLDSATVENIALSSTQLETVRSELRKYRSRAPKDAELRHLYASLLRVETLLATELGKYESRLEAVAARKKDD
jgi:hypothetical protein